MPVGAQTREPLVDRTLSKRRSARSSVVIVPDRRGRFHRGCPCSGLAASNHSTVRTGRYPTDFTDAQWADLDPLPPIPRAWPVGAGGGRSLMSGDRGRDPVRARQRCRAASCCEYPVTIVRGVGDVGASPMDVHGRSPVMLCWTAVSETRPAPPAPPTISPAKRSPPPTHAARRWPSPTTCSAAGPPSTPTPPAAPSSPSGIGQLPRRSAASRAPKDKRSGFEKGLQAFNNFAGGVVDAVDPLNHPLVSPVR
ncbi:hypothetical protein FHS29_007224 [Saccharothrix tamanrassetensis]|uniref:Uncharacterized protein n=1 Tax=Saccharothrix tamanrassetensis TaxID=1051531 RepID=A0A841CZ56_9PSEU|nr:hypothetical protein [Saccharothrix tamanrassetensis]